MPQASRPDLATTKAEAPDPHADPHLDPRMALGLRGARVHEAQGRGRVAFALFQMARHRGALFWITPARNHQRLMMGGLPFGVGERLHLVEAASEKDLLWATEEALRASPAGLVVAEPEKPLSLTAGRRLQLAAEAGGTTGLMLIGEGRGSNAAESRWHCEPVAGAAPSVLAVSRGALPDPALHHWQLVKNKSAPCRGWLVAWDGATADDLVLHEAENPQGLQTPPVAPAFAPVFGADFAVPRKHGDSQDQSENEAPPRA